MPILTLKWEAELAGWFLGRMLSSNVPIFSHVPSVAEIQSILMRTLKSKAFHTSVVAAPRPWEPGWARERVWVQRPIQPGARSDLYLYLSRSPWPRQAAWGGHAKELPAFNSSSLYRWRRWGGGERKSQTAGKVTNSIDSLYGDWFKNNDLCLCSKKRNLYLFTLPQIYLWKIQRKSSFPVIGENSVC